LESARRTSSGGGTRSLNHLLNFTFAERQRPPPLPSTVRARRHATPYSKERYVNAKYRPPQRPSFLWKGVGSKGARWLTYLAPDSFRFMVAPTAEWAARGSDPDTPLAWGAVEQAVRARRVRVCLAVRVWS
jgi:hypothetical protein